MQRTMALIFQIEKGKYEINSSNLIIPIMEYCWRGMGKTFFPINGEGNLNDGNTSSIALPGSDFTFCIFSTCP